MQPTPQFFPVPCAMLVGVDDQDAEAVLAALAPLKILKVGHVPAACERMLATWPLVVVLGSRPKDSELEALRATALDISAQVVLLPDFPDPARRQMELLAAKRAAAQMRDAVAYGNG